MKNYEKFIRYFTWEKFGVKKLLCLLGIIIMSFYGFGFTIYLTSKPSTNRLYAEYVSSTRKYDYILLTIVIILLAIFLCIYKKKPGNIMSYKEFDILKNKQEQEVLNNYFRLNGISEDVLKSTPCKFLTGYLIDKIERPLFYKIDKDNKLRSSLCQITLLLMGNTQLEIIQCTYSLINNEYHNNRYVIKRNADLNIRLDSSRINCKSSFFDNSELKVTFPGNSLRICINNQTNTGEIMKEINEYLM